METAFTDFSLSKQQRNSICEVHGEYIENGIIFNSKQPKWTGCPQCHAERKAIEEQKRIDQKKQEEQEKIEKRLSMAGIPLKFRDRSFDNYIADTQDKQNALNIARHYLEDFDDNYKTGATLIFAGKAGTGKTHLAMAIAKGVMPKHTAMYINALDAIRMVRDTWRRDSERSELQVLELLGSIDLLVIDEVGVQTGTENEQMLMFDIINRRYRDSKPMILLTNLDKKGFADYMTERSADRLRENGSWVTFNWESYRRKE
jgi:DNA replication protein DnaC